MVDSNETELPMVGRKTSLTMEGGERIEVVIHSNGTRDISLSAPDSAEVRHLLRLDPTTACALGALLCAALEPPPTRG